ncbi:iron ABC transporter permease [Psychromonas sp. B3M02]|uniref:FecCD family ABC transporter permease n=1 Tax=Psychromonas sp. B3M02 TaxID=2267226 RepID=UPI000DEBD941|nr:iron ABC transporter permease [Psychromonas sp. B3M02]RBW47631.1 iron ABC transporter permease [Psychromonas sp. B3M02]
MHYTLRLCKQAVSLRFNSHALLYTALLTAVLFGTFLYAITEGSYPLSLHDSVMSLLRQQQAILDPQANVIIWEFRLPRSLVALLSGALFALSGALLQNMTRNPLSDPSLVGISQGAALAVVTLTILFPSYIDNWREIAAFIGAVTIAIVIQLLRGNGHPLKFILLGVGVAAFISAIISSLLTYGDLPSAMAALSWLAGSTHNSNWHDVHVLALAFMLIISLTLYQARMMSVISLGDEVAIGLGINLKAIMLMQLSISVAAAAIATAVVGPLGFIGLLAPHLARKLVRSGPANHLFLTALVGALLVLIADLIGRSVFAPTQLAAGSVTALIGAPLFAYLLITKKN